MSVTTSTREPGTAGPADASARVRVSVTAVATVAGATRVTRSRTDVVRLVRSGTRVVGSHRLPAGAGHPGVARARESAGDLLSAVHAGLAGLCGPGPAIPDGRARLVPQSILATVGVRARVLVRLESDAGTLLVGGSGPDAAGAALRALAGLGDLRPPGPPPPHWSGRRVLLRPAVAAVAVVGARLVLGTRAAAPLAGRRILPGLTLVDLPAEHAEGEPDDAGVPATSYPLARGGRIEALPRDPDTGLPAGRAVWQHDRGALAAAPVLGLALRGPPDAPARPVPEDAVELFACVEGLRRYHPDGWLRLACAARLGPSGTTFLVGLRARPLDLLRAVTAVAGAPAGTHTDHDVSTPSVLLPCADELTRRCRVRLTPL